MSESISRALARRVRKRAGDVCEYCHLPQSGQEARFHLDHILPKSAGGRTIASNLALACVTCSLKKANRARVPDPETGDSVPIFHPRRDRWADHFEWARGWRLVGRTPTGRATVSALGMNRPAVVAIRGLLAELGLLVEDDDKS